MESEDSDVSETKEEKPKENRKYCSDALFNAVVNIWKFLFVNEAAVSNLIEKIHRPGEVRKMKEDAVQAMASDSPVDRVSRMAFPLAFFVFNVTYWFQYLYERESQAINHGDKKTAGH